MSIEAIGAVLGDAPLTAAITPKAATADFMTAIGDGLGSVDQSLKAANAQLRQLAAGKDVPMHEVMIAMERARLDLMLVTEVRNRLVEAYQELTRMQL